MTNINAQWRQEIILPDGSTASCSADVDRYLKESETVLASDYSGNFYRRVRWQKKEKERQKLFRDFINSYKRSIWCDG